MEVFVKVGGAGTSTRGRGPPATGASDGSMGASAVAGREAEAVRLDAGSGDTVGGGTFEN